ncbi:lysophospholipid acyltransferase family protein [Parahaliea maris]|uniref:L-ornithine N(alpha)-acyltransferase n=1 Tax=Parahaliea maris TaxID=2716870 RepID=A0A5C9A059_9GAMM|nr:GNAT family N-acyltransferase [Parahaliea maris]TXS92801.1 lysophospholipid acyltransferase family protein [Parahaliea maris]
MLNIQNVLETRYPSFFQRHARSARTLSRFLGFLFYQSRFEQFGRDYPHLRGFDFVDATLGYFDFTLKLRDNERVRIPTSGRVVIAANHPIGSLDGLALLNLVRQVRPDVKVVANDLLTAIEPLHPVLLPVNNMGGNTARQNLRAIREHLEQDGALIIFPAGEVSRFGAKGVKDGEWQSGFVKIASATRSPVLPVFVAGRNSLFFYSLSFLARPLSTLWLVREMFKQSHNAVEARVGKPIPYDNYASLDLSAQKIAKMFRKHVYRIARDRRPIFRSIETVAAPENPLLVKRELEQAEHLGSTADGKQMYLCRMDDAPCVMRELGRLRELTFRSVGEGTGLPRDVDRFDRDYRHLVLWDATDMEIAGAYRLGDARALLARGGKDALYTHTLFEFGPGMQPYLEQGLELGRSFVQPKYQTRHSLDYLWQGIGAFLCRNPEFRYLFGPASISRLYGTEAIARIAWFFSSHYQSMPLEVTPRTPFTIQPELQARLASEYTGLDREEDLKALRDTLAEQGMPIPVLYKHYAGALEPDGVVFTAFNIDHDFGDCVDGFVLADLTRLTERKRKRYLGTGTGDVSAT